MGKEGIEFIIILTIILKKSQKVVSQNWSERVFIEIKVVQNVILNNFCLYD